MYVYCSTLFISSVQTLQISKTLELSTLILIYYFFYCIESINIVQRVKKKVQCYMYVHYSIIFAYCIQTLQITKMYATQFYFLLFVFVYCIERKDIGKREPSEWESSMLCMYAALSFSCTAVKL